MAKPQYPGKPNGGAGNDMLAGGGGSDQPTGGAGADIFMFARVKGEVQHDVITDFNFAAGHRLALHGPHGYTVAVNSAGNAVLTIFSENTIELVGIKADDINAAWFDLG
jgi:hypothetical protein